MNIILRASTFFVIAFVIAFAVASCDKNDAGASTEICPYEDDVHICSVPFESIFSHRELFVGRIISIDGVMLIGTRQEPPGSNIPIILLFPSIERLAFCNPRFAIELGNVPADHLSVLRAYQGRFVNVVGRFIRSNNAHWGAIELISDPSPQGLGSNFAADVYGCMQPPPPPPTPPSVDAGKK